MAYHFDFDSTNRILRGRFEAAVTDDEFRRYLQVTWKYVAWTAPVAGITDLSGVTSWEVTAETLHTLGSMPPGVRPRGWRRIVLATSDRIFEMMRIFERHAQITRPNLHVVRTMNEARAILGVQKLHFEAIGT